MKPRSVEDLGLIVALVRPGPDRAFDASGKNAKDRYLDRRSGKEEVSYVHPMLEDILGPTFGVFIYQEQILKFFGALGYTPGEADAMRKILGKKQPQLLGALFEGKGEWKGRGWLELALEAGWKEDDAGQLWKDLEGFDLLLVQQEPCHRLRYHCLPLSARQVFCSRRVLSRLHENRR